jgi:hypothetical protein
VVIYPNFLYAPPASAACADFIKESRMKIVATSTLQGKSGIWGTRIRGRARNVRDSISDAPL